MTIAGNVSRGIQRSRNGGYLIVMFVVIVAFVGVVASMQVLVLTSVATTSRAYDTYRQGATESVRLERVVAETILDARQIAVSVSTTPLAEALNVHLRQLTNGDPAITATVIPSSLPSTVGFPNATAVPDALSSVSADLQPYLTPELALLVGPRVAAYPEATFEFASERTVLDATRTYRTQVKARLMAVPLTRFPIAAYDLPVEIGRTDAAPVIAPSPDSPRGLVPSRDAAFVPDLQAQKGVLPYHYRRRATLAAAYQYLFSQLFVDRVAEYAGITHFHDLDAASGTATLAGMSTAGLVTSWDLALAGSGTYGTVTLIKDAAVVFTEEIGKTIRLSDSVGSTATSPLFLLILGPADSGTGPLTVELTTIARPIVIVGYNIRVIAGAGTALNGALFLDPTSTMNPDGPITVGHLSYWSGSTGIPEHAVTSAPLPSAIEAIAPRVVYVATNTVRL